MKVFLISINSDKENTGGGIYLRTLKMLYERNGYKVCIFSKDCDLYKVKKNVITDLIGRLILCPSYIGYYIFHILIYSRKFNVIAIHSTRLGIIAKIIKLIYPDKRIIVHSDNVESILIRELRAKDSLAKKILMFIDRLLMPFSERCCGKYSYKMTFITDEDKIQSLRNNFVPVSNKYFTIPVLLDKPNSKDLEKDNSVLFTGSFDFYPNQHAFMRLINLANANINTKFVVAGRYLSKFIEREKIRLPSNMIIFSDISSYEMDHLYRKAMLFICPVSYGSGMKTKVAEALSYDLYVIADERSTFGYQKAVSNKVVYKYSDDFFDSCEIGQLEKIIEKLTNKTNFYSITPSVIFEKYYSIDSGMNIFGRVLQ
ncbi:glycosyltransferase [Escherichia albertii]|nr:glycosyltransferase [Escherichia albertii]MCZ9114884.1 glycosyltransferase [Escherichia albertii]MCZ9194923.1 glycosyltransferase [Escherichia albertii]MCZ9216656.1 glycosyltransferase [Escherichia albertii]MCZ9223673.1 glycosyltransferase [Escherichia albertii]